MFSFATEFESRMKKRNASASFPSVATLTKKWEKIWNNLNETNSYFQSYIDTILLVHQKIKMEPLINSFEALKKSSQDYYDSLDEIVKSSKTIKPVEVKLPWDSDKFKEEWRVWKEYLLEQHQIELASRTEAKQLAQLYAIADGKEENCYPVLDYAISNLYKMFFRLEQRNNKSKGKTKTIRKDDDF